MLLAVLSSSLLAAAPPPSAPAPVAPRWLSAAGVAAVRAQNDTVRASQEPGWAREREAYGPWRAALAAPTFDPAALRAAAKGMDTAQKLPGVWAGWAEVYIALSPADRTLLNRSLSNGGQYQPADPPPPSASRPLSDVTSVLVSTLFRSPFSPAMRAASQRLDDSRLALHALIEAGSTDALTLAAARREQIAARAALIQAASDQLYRLFAALPADDQRSAQRDLDSPQLVERLERIAGRP